MRESEGWQRQLSRPCSRVQRTQMWGAEWCREEVKADGLRLRVYVCGGL